MKSLVVYSSKYGTTKYCAEKIASGLKNVDIVSVDEQSSINCHEYEQCFIGSSIYMGRLRKNMRKFFMKHEDQLKKKKVHLFVCCNDITDYKSIFPETVVKQAASLTHFGHELKISDMKFFDRMITKKVNESSENTYDIKEAVLSEYVKRLSR